MRAAVETGQGLGAPDVETYVLPEDPDDPYRKFLALTECYEFPMLAKLLDCDPAQIEQWKAARRKPRTIYENLSFLNRLDAATDVTRAFAGLLESEQIQMIIFRPFEQLDGRSLADMITAADSFQAGPAAERIAESLRRKRQRT